jgi:hypothetical protein
MRREHLDLELLTWLTALDRRSVDREHIALVDDGGIVAKFLRRPIIV